MGLRFAAQPLPRGGANDAAGAPRPRSAHKKPNAVGLSPQAPRHSARFNMAACVACLHARKPARVALGGRSAHPFATPLAARPRRKTKTCVATAAAPRYAARCKKGSGRAFKPQHLFVPPWSQILSPAARGIGVIISGSPWPACPPASRLFWCCKCFVVATPLRGLAPPARSRPRHPATNRGALSRRTATATTHLRAISSYNILW